MHSLALWHDPGLMQRSRIAPCGRESAIKAAAILIGGYPSIKTHDPHVFAQHVIQLLSEYPADLVEVAAQQVPRTVNYLSVAAIHDWLEGRMRERRQLHAETIQAAEAARQKAGQKLHDAEVLTFRAEYLAWLRDHPDGTVVQFAKFTANRF